MFRKYIHLFAALLAMIVIAGQSHAGLLDDTLDFPKISFDNQGTTNYVVSEHMLSIKATPLFIELSGSEVTPITGDCQCLWIKVQVDNSGALVGGVPEDDLAVIGTVDLGYGSFSGVLLTGEITAFGSYNSDGTTDSFDFRFEVSGGELSSLYHGKNIGVKVTSDHSSFEGSFNEDFGGEAKGTLGAVAPICDGSIGDLVWHDLNRNGIQDAEEPGIQGVGVKLTGMDIAGNAVLMTDITDENGNYLFPGLCEGTYEVNVDLATVPEGFEVTTPCSNNQTIGNDSNSDDTTNCTPTQTVELTTDNSDNPTIDFGFVSPCDGSIGDLVWHDLNRNGIQDAEEPGIQGVGVELTGTDVAGNTVSMTDITDGSGNYLFPGLCEGTYVVNVELATVPAGYDSTTPCSSDQTIDDDSNSDDMTNCTPSQTVDLPDSNTDNTTIDFGFITPDCTLKVTKTCFVKEPPTSDFDCSDAKPIDSLTMVWGGSNDIESIDVYRDKHDPNDPMKRLMYTIAGPIGMGDEVTADGYAAVDAKNDVDWVITFSDGTEGISRFHRSCSDDDMNGPEDCGKREGNSKDDITGFINDWIFEGMAGLTSGFECNPDLPGSTSECTFHQAPPSPHCEGKLEAITLCYLSGSCPEPLLNTQPSDKQSCSGDADAVQPVRIVITDGGSKIFLYQDGVEINDIVTATAANAGENEFSSNTVFEIFDESGVLIQNGNFHTSCSQPLNLGDQFGSLQVVGMQTTEGGSVALGADVEYTYMVENKGDVAVSDVTVSDSVLGIVPGSPIESLVSGETVELFMTAFVDKTTTNIVTVTGETDFGDNCSAMDSATVTMLLPPPCIVSPVEFKIADDKIEWKLSNDGDKVVTIDSIEISWPEALGDLKKVKNDGDTIFEGPVPPSSVLITSDMMTSDLKKRQIKPGESEKVEFEFAAKASTVPMDYEITVNFAERCSVTFEPEDIPFVCSDATPIDSLTMIWDGTREIASICVYRDKHDPNDPMKHFMYTIDGPIVMGDEVTADGYAAADAKNDVDWVITFSDGTEGISRFHRSCSDDDMNGPEDCGKAEGNSKDDNTGFINYWIFEGMAGNGLTLDCTP